MWLPFILIYRKQFSKLMTLQINNIRDAQNSVKSVSEHVCLKN